MMLARSHSLQGLIYSLLSSFSGGYQHSLACGHISPVFKAKLFKSLCSVFTLPVPMCMSNLSLSSFYFILFFLG